MYKNFIYIYKYKLYIFIYIYIYIYIVKSLAQKKLPKWLRNICTTKNVFLIIWEYIYIYIYIYNIYIYISLTIHTWKNLCLTEKIH